MLSDHGSATKKANVLLGLQFLSDFGDQISAALLALCLLDITQSTAKVGLVYFLTTFGFIVFTFAGGILGDHISKKNILFFSDLGRGVVVLLIIVAIQQKSIMLIYLSSFLLSILGSLHRPVKLSIWAESIPDNRLERYNSLSELSVQGSTILGPLIASFFILHSVTNVGFVIDALTFFICAIAFVNIIREKPLHNDASMQPKKDYLAGFRLIFHNAEMAKYVLYDSIQMIGYGAFNATFLVLAQRDFGFSQMQYSYHLSIVAVFTTLGALLGATDFMEKIPAPTKLAACALASSFMMFAALFCAVFPLTSLLIGMCNALGIATMATTRTKVQIVAKSQHANALSSILAARTIVIRLATLLGVAACLVMDDFMTLKTTLILNVLPIGLSALPLVLAQRTVSGSIAMTGRLK